MKPDPYDFRELSPSQQSVLAAGGWRPGDYVVGAAPHGRPTWPCIRGLMRRGLLVERAIDSGSVYAVPSDVAAAFRARRLRLAQRRADQDERRAQEGV